MTSAGSEAPRPLAQSSREHRRPDAAAWLRRKVRFSGPSSRAPYAPPVRLAGSRRARLAVASAVLLLLVVLAFVPVGSSDDTVDGRLVREYHSVLSLLAGGSVHGAYGVVALMGVAAVAGALYLWAVRAPR